MGRGVRTVQRWEKALGLPVHRIGQGPRSPACAFPAELDAWLQRMAAHDGLSSRQARLLPPVSDKVQSGSAVTVSRMLVQQSAELAHRMTDATHTQRMQAASMRRAFEEMKKLLDESIRLTALQLNLQKKSAVRQLRKTQSSKTHKRAGGD